MSIKILVTGAGGQLGKTIEALYSENKMTLDFTFVTRDILDITNTEDVLKFFKNNSFDYCINCAAYTNVEQAEKTPEIAYKVNAEGVKYLAEVCKKNHVTLIHISTDYVFDGNKNEPYTTADATHPINEYGKSKLLGEQYVQAVMNHYFIIRTSWLYSKKYGNNFYQTILNLAKTKTEISITTDQVGCPTNTENLTKFIVELIQNEDKAYGIYHFSDKTVMTWYDFAVQILAENQMLSTIKLVKANKYLTFAERPKNSVLQN